MHHADPQRIGVIGVPDGHLFAILFDDPLLRLIQSEQHTHQGGFPGAVRADNAVAVAAHKLQVDVLEQILPAEIDSQIGNGNHSILLVGKNHIPI